MAHKFSNTLAMFPNAFAAFNASEDAIKEHDEARLAKIEELKRTFAFYFAVIFSRSTGWTADSLTARKDSCLSDLSDHILTGLFGVDVKKADAPKTAQNRANVWATQKGQVKTVLEGCIASKTFRARVVKLAEAGALDVTISALAREADEAMGKTGPTKAELAIKALIRCDFPAETEAAILAMVREAAGIEV